MAFLDYLPSILLPIILFAVARQLKGWKGSSQLPFPPGPKPRFITGNLQDIPTDLPWLTYTEWGKQYGALKKNSWP
jgi:hypothetical protein